MSNMRKLGTCLAMVALAILAFTVVMPDADAADLKNVSDFLSTPVTKTPATHTIAFATATAETIKSVDITFPNEFVVSGVTLGTVLGLNPGTLLVTGQVVTYTVTNEIPVIANQSIQISLDNVLNATVGGYTVTVATKDATPAMIDGPTASSIITITSAPLVNVTNAVNPAIAGTAATHTVAFTTATTGDIASVVITFPAGFDLTTTPVGVGTVTPATIAAGTVAAAGQAVTYTVTPPASVAAATAITIPLTGIVNAAIGNYTVDVETRDATPILIDGPTTSAVFTITPPPLTSVTNTVAPTATGATATHTVAFTTATTGTIASVDITFPVGFDLATTPVGVGTATGINPGTVVATAQVVTYTVAAPVSVAASTDITIPLTGVVNAPDANYNVIVETKDAAATIDGPTQSAQFTITPPEFVRLIVRVDNESWDENSPTGKTGTPIFQNSGIPFNVYVRAVDHSWAHVTSATPEVEITATDAGATITPLKQDLVAGGGTFSVTLSGIGSHGITASDTDTIDPKQSGSTSVPVAGIRAIQTSVYDPAGDHYASPNKDNPNKHGAVDAGTSNLPLAYITVVGGAGGTTWDTLSVYYSGQDLGDIVGPTVRLAEDTNNDGLLTEDPIATLVRSANFGANYLANLTFSQVINEGEEKNYFLVVNIASGATSHRINLDIRGSNPPIAPSQNLTDPLQNVLATGYSHIDALGPELVVTSGVTPVYDTGTKILTLEFTDDGAFNGTSVDDVPTPRVNVIDKDGDNTVWKVNLSKIKIRAADNSPSLTDLTGASFLYPDGTEIPDENPDEVKADQSTVKIKLTPAQDAFIQDSILPEAPEIYINGALTDYNFGNAIGEVEKALYIEGDLEKPSLVADKPVSFDYTTGVLELIFKESIDTTEVDLEKIYIMNYIFDPLADADPDITEERIIIDVDSVMNLRDASVEESFGVTLKMTLTPAQGAILKGDHPQLYLDAGAVEDITGNPNDPPPLSIVPVSDFVDEFIEYVDAKYEAGEYPDIGAADVYVTPPILSGVESIYNGNVQQVSQTSFDHPEDYHTYDAVLDLKFTAELSTDVDATKIIVTNENGEQPFTLTQSRYDSVLSIDSRIVRLLLTKRSKTYQKAKIAFWQLEDSGIDELHVEVGAGAVKDIFGNSNEAIEVTQRINWLKDTEGPRVVDSTSYGHSSQVLKLAFDECIDLESDNLDELVDLGKITLEAEDGTLAGDSFTLNKDEDLIKAGQKNGIYLSITLSNDHRDKISSWDFAGGTKFILKTSTGAVYDIVGNTKPEYIAGYPLKNWSEDTVRPTFKSPAFYSIDEQMLVLRFSEPLYGTSNDHDLTQYNPELNNTLRQLIKVHPAAEKANIESLEDAIFEVSGDALKIDLSGTAATIVDAREILEEKINPQVDILVGAVYDLARNSILNIEDRSITLDPGGPELSSTGNIYEHISLDENEDLVTDGLVTVKFTEVIDGKSIKLSKIKLQAGVTSVDLSSAVNAITGDTNFPNSNTFKIKLTDDGKVGRIASLQRDYHPNLSVVLEAEAIADLAGNLNVAGSQVVDTWTGDTKKPEIKLRESYYIHDLTERSKHYARLVLVFDEPMDTETIDASGVVITDGGNSMVTLTAEEIKPDQALSNEIQFNLTDAHRETISVWGEPKVIGAITDTGGLTKTELSIYLAENSVTDTAGNSVVVSPSARVFAKAAPYKTAVDERKYDKALAADAAKEEGKDYSTWEQDLTAAKFVSGAYNANTRVLTVTFDEWMDVAPVGLADSTKIRIYDADSLTNGGEYVDLAGGATENGKTKTVTFTLTTEKGVAVNALKTPLYIELLSEDTTTVKDGILDVGPARDIAGQVCDYLEKDADTKISYTADTSAPTLVISNGDDTTYRDKGKDFDAPDDITGLLSLVFNEGVDKDYNSIKASKIRLSNADTAGSGFTLTQDEIHDAAGRRVYPLAPAKVHIIQFDLNDEHWNTVADEKWSTMYIHMEAGAISDTSGNGVAAVTIAIHADHYHPDNLMPEVDITTEVSSASSGQDIDITATVVDDSPIVEVRLYYQVGGQVRTYVAMENTSGNTYEGKIPDTAVTNKGLCYYVWAKDLWDNENITGNGNIKTKGGDWWYTSIPGGFNVKVTGTPVELPANTLPVFDASAVPSTYRMISVPIVPSPAINSTDLFSPFGVAGIDWVSWKYTGGSEYNGYAGGHIDPFGFSPKSAAWIGTVNPNKALTVTGETSQISNSYDDSDVAGQRYLAEIKLSAGWNQIAVPFNFSRNWDKDTIPNWNADNIADVIYWFSGDKSAYNFASIDSTVPNQDVFETSWTGSGIPDNELVWSGWPGSLDPWGGYWIYCNQEGMVLKIDPTIPGKGVLPATPTAPSVQMPYSWSVKVIPEASGVFGTAKFAGIVSDASDGIDSYDVMDLPALPGQAARLAFIIEDGDYLQDMKAPADEMFWNFKASAAVNTPVTLRFDASDVPSEYRTVLLIDTVTEAATDLRKASSYAYKSSEKIRTFKLIISKAHIETYIVPKHSVLLQNYPNPFNPETWVPYRLATAGDVKINIYNVTGQLVRTLELGRREAGSYTAKERAAYWDGRNVTGERVASGVYFYNVQSGSFHATKRMVIVK